MLDSISVSDDKKGVPLGKVIWHSDLLWNFYKLRYSVCMSLEGVKTKKECSMGSES